MIETTIVPIVKNKRGNLSDSNNYRPITLACEISLDTCPNQFGFKKRNSRHVPLCTKKND